VGPFGDHLGPPNWTGSVSDAGAPENPAPEGAPADEATPAEAGADAPAQAEPETE
jgi:hypothetical protein